MILWDIIEEHLDEASFIWTQWERTLESPEYQLQEVLEGPEERLHANLEGLVQGGDAVARKLLLPALDEEDPGLVCASALALLSGGMEAHTEELVKRLAMASPALRPCFARVLGLAGAESVTLRLMSLLREDVPSAVLATVLDILENRAVPPGAALEPFLRGTEPDLWASALRIAARTPGRLDRNTWQRALGSPDPIVQEAALEAGLLMGFRAAWRTCQDHMHSPGSLGRTAMLLFALGAHPKELPMLSEKPGSSGRQIETLWALGFSGQVLAAEACLEWMSDKAVARVAAEAFCAITGLVLEGPYVREEPEPQEDSDAPEQEDLDADLSLKPEAALALPEPVEIRTWWSQARSRFTPGTRYLYGKPFDAPALAQALLEAPMRRRHVLALELAIRSRGEHVLRTRAFAREQRSKLAGMKLNGASLSTRSFTDWVTL
ncbi:TIGR02270 family protein [Pyxidicoccus sp. 3LG]